MIVFIFFYFFIMWQNYYIFFNYQHILHKIYTILCNTK